MVVSYKESGFTVTSDRDYKKGEELFISYGSHSNDFLLVHYGFILQDNRWDSLLLDDLVLSFVNAENQQHLQDYGYLGNYALTPHGACYRTQVAMLIQIMDHNDWLKLIAGRRDEGEERKDEARVDRLIKTELLEKYHQEARHALTCWAEPEAAITGIPGQSTIHKRWSQIELLVEGAL